jgi:hypothetical protein
MRIGFVVAALALACADDKDDGAGSSGTGTTGSTSGGSSGSTSGGSSGSTSSGSDGDGGSSSGGGPCDGFEDETIGDAVSVSIRNDLDEPVFVAVGPGCYVTPVFSLEGPGGPMGLEGPDCGTCEGAIAGNCPCPGAPCANVAFLWLDAGATFDTTWSGATFQRETLPAVCVEHGMCPADCIRVLASEAGAYTFSVLAATSASGCFEEPCACTPTEGWCFIDGDGTLGEPQIDADATIDYPSDTSVEIVIQ